MNASDPNHTLLSNPFGLSTDAVTGKLISSLLMIILIAAIGYIATFLVLASLRIQYPFELEWMEGGVIDHVKRVVVDKPLYVEPSIEFTPYIYAPLYYYAVAAWSQLTWVGFGAARFVSIISTLGSILLIFLIVGRKTTQVYWGITAACLYAATYRFTGAWFDIARADAMFLFLILLTVYVTLFRRSSMSGWIAALLMSAACLTKQSGLIIAAPLALYYLIYDKRAAHFIAGLAVMFGGSVLYLNLQTDGWFFFYVFELPSNHPIYDSRYLYFWTTDILPHMPVAVGATILWFSWARHNMGWRDITFWTLLLSSMIGSAMLSRAHSGGYDNVLMPAAAVLSITFGLGINALFKKAMDTKCRRGISALIGIGVACLVQFGVLMYNPAAQVPSRADLEAGISLLERIRETKGDVLVPFHGYFASIVNKRPYAHQMALHDVIRGTQKYTALLDQQLLKAAEQKKFAAVILDAHWHSAQLEDYYGQAEKVFGNPDVFYPVTGYRIRPDSIYFPKP